MLFKDNTKMQNYNLSKTHHNKFNITIGDIKIFFVCVICAIYVFIINRFDYYAALPFLPFCYGLFYLVILSPVVNFKKARIGMIVAVCEFLRCVFLPVFISFTDISEYNSYFIKDNDVLNLAILLMIYEMFVLFLFTRFIITKKQHFFTREKSVNLPKNDKTILLIMAVLSIIVFLVWPEMKGEVSFLFLDASSDRVRTIVRDNYSTINLIIIKFLQFSLFSLFIITLDYCSKKYDIYSDNIYIWLSVIAGILTMSFIFRESRITIIYTFFAIFSCLLLKFPSYKKRITILLGFSAVFLIVGMTIYRLFAVYNFSSYISALDSSNIKDNYWSSFLDSYLLGPQSVALGVTFKNAFANFFTIENFFYDIFRPFIGINFFLKDIDMDTTITMYNSWLHNTTDQSNGLLLQITNQCYCYLGFLLSPLFVCFFVWLSAKFEILMQRTNNLFVFFFLNYVYIRTITSMFCGTMSGIITTCSMTALFAGVIFLVQKSFSSLFGKSIRF